MYHNIDSFTQRLEQKRQAFLAYESTTAAMLTCELEELEGRMRRREELAAQSDRIDEELAVLLQQAGGDAPLLREALSGRASRDSLPGEMLSVYDLAAGTRAVIGRIRELEGQLLPRLEAEKEELLVKIREINASAEAQASRFASGTESGRITRGTFGRA